MTVNCSDEIPHSEDFFKFISDAELVCSVFSGVLSLMTLSLFIEHIISIRKHYQTFTSVLFKAAVILSVYPAVSMFSFFAVCFPRAHLVCNLCASIYISIGIYNFMAVLLDYFGGKEELLRHTRNDTIRLCFAPFFCCCLPPFKITRKVLNIAHFLVGQLAILQILISFLSLVLWLDGKFIIGKVSVDTAGIYFTVAKMIATFLGVGGLRLMVNICTSIDKSLNIPTKSQVLNIVLVLHNMQGFIFNILAAHNIPECSPELSTKVRGRAWYSMIVILEMFLLGVAARCLYQQPHKASKSAAESKEHANDFPRDIENSSPEGLIAQDLKDKPI